MGKMVEATRMGYYGEVRRRPGDQFLMADAMFVKETPVLDKDGKPVMKDGKPEVTRDEDSAPSWVVVVEEGFEDPIIESEAEKKAKDAGKPVKRVAAKKQSDEHVQGGHFDVHPESGVQVTGQVAPARPAASSFVDPGAPTQAHKEEKGKKSTGDKSVI